MSKYTLPNGTAGLDDTMVGLVQAVPSFIPMMLFFIYASVFLAGYTGQKRSTGTADPALWAVLAGLSTTLVTLLLSVRQGLVQIEILSAVLGITILSTIWLFIGKGRYE